MIFLEQSLGGVGQDRPQVILQNDDVARKPYDLFTSEELAKPGPEHVADALADLPEDQRKTCQETSLSHLCCAGVWAMRKESNYVGTEFGEVGSLRLQFSAGKRVVGFVKLGAMMKLQSGLELYDQGIARLSALAEESAITINQTAECSESCDLAFAFAIKNRQSHLRTR